MPGQGSIALLPLEHSIARTVLTVLRLLKIIILNLQIHSNHQRQRIAMEVMGDQVIRLLFMLTSMNSRRLCPPLDLSLLVFILDDEDGEAV